jgi:hypothetical protein
LWQFLLTAREASLASGRNPDEALEAARAAVLAVWPSLPARHLSEVLDVLAKRAPFPEADHAPTGASDAPKLVAREDVVACLAYALRHDARGKPTPGTKDLTAKLAAEWIADHLARSRFVISRLPPPPLHRAGG